MRLDGRVAEPVTRAYREAVLDVKPWEYEISYTKSVELAHILRTVALSQSVRIANYDC